MNFRARLLPSLRMGVAAFVLTGAALIGVQQLGAQGIASHNSDAPVDYAADRIELEDKQNRVVLSGNVDIRQAELRMQAARTTVAYDRTNGIKIQRIDATGGVHITRNDEEARGDVAIYDFDRRVITMVGNVHLRRGSDTLNGGRLVMDLNSGVSSVDGRSSGSSSALGGTGSSGGRVSGSFSVPKKKS